MPKLFLSCLLLTVPSGAIACDLDGFAGMHRFNPFGGMNGQPVMEPAEVPRRQTEESRQQGQKASTARMRSSERSEEAPRKWEVEGGQSVTAEDKATFT